MVEPAEGPRDRPSKVGQYALSGMCAQPTLGNRRPVAASLYPSNARLVRAFKRELEPYEVNDKGTIRFPLSEPVPVKLIEGIAKFRAKEVAESRRRVRPRG